MAYNGVVMILPTKKKKTTNSPPTGKRKSGNVNLLRQLNLDMVNTVQCNGFV